MSNKKVIVIGAGFSGLTGASLLARDGFDVTVLEKNDRAGGRALVYREKGYSFDMGPSWYMMLEAFERYFAEFGKKPDDFYETIRLDPSYRVIFDKDDVVDISANIEDNYKLFDEIEKDGANKLKKFVEKSKEQYDIALKHLIYRDYDTLSDLLDKDLIASGLKLKITSSFQKYAEKFFSTEKALKLIEYSIAFVGGGPAISPAVYCMLTHTDLNLGIWYPVGGMGKIIDAIHKIGKEQGVDFKFNHEVKKIKVEDGKATGVETKKGFFEADIILNTADYHHGETELLDEKYQAYPESYWKKKILAPAGYRIFLGLDKKLDGVLHHTLYLNKDWDSYFEEVYGKNPVWPTDPSYYVCCPSKNDETIAPKGGEAFSILVLVGPGIEDTPEIREKYYEKTMDHFENIIGQNIRDSIVVKKIFTIKDFISTYNAYKGTALGMAHTLRQTAVGRPSHQSKKVKNLYYAGHYTHPGIGVPVSIISGQLASDKITKNHA
jgi:phytoene desaturase